MKLTSNIFILYNHFIGLNIFYQAKIIIIKIDNNYYIILLFTKGSILI
jgi:hypothetical protein